jgi:ribonucleoside-diphosphate reductase alpha chain
MLEEHPLFVEEAKRRGLYSRALMSQLARKGSLLEIQSIPDDLKRLFTCALDVPPAWHVKMQAAFQAHTDNAVSKTVNLPASASQKDVREVYLLAHQLGCKGITVFRYGSKGDQTLMLEMDAEETGSCRQCAT